MFQVPSLFICFFFFLFKKNDWIFVFVGKKEHEFFYLYFAKTGEEKKEEMAIKLKAR